MISCGTLAAMSRVRPQLDAKEGLMLTLGALYLSIAYIAPTVVLVWALR